MKSLPYAILFAALLALCNAGAAKEADPRTLTLDIAAQPVGDALNEFARQSGLQVVIDPLEGHGIMAARVVGKFTADAALAQLLSNTGLRYEYLDERTVAVRAAKAQGEARQRGAEARTGSSAGVHLAEGETPAAAAEENQSTVARKADDGVEEMLVEGERDKPAPFTANMDIARTVDDAQPYYIFDSKTIERSGAANIEDFLKQRLTMNTTAQTNGQISAVTSSTPNDSVSGNTSTINLRGLGTDKTLILVNGRRMPEVFSTKAPAQPDLNGIPLSAIDRIEVLPSSSSGIYGGSAIGGVVNVILKKDYAGGQLQVSYDGTWGLTDAYKRTVSGNYGWTLEGGRTHLNANAAWSDGKPLLLKDRVSIYRENLATLVGNAPTFLFTGSTPWLGAVPNIRSAYVPVPAGTPGSIELQLTPDNIAMFGITSEKPAILSGSRGGFLQLKDGTNLGSANTYIPPGTSPDTSVEVLAAGLQANAGQWNLDFPLSTQTPTGLLRPFGVSPKTKSFMVNISRQMLPRLQLTADASFVENRSGSIFNPMPSFVFVNADAPANPFGTQLRVQVPDGTQIPVATRSQNRSASIGALAQLPGSWVADLDYAWSENRFNFLYYNIDGALANGLSESGGALNIFVDTLSYPLDIRGYLAPNAYGGLNRLYDAAVRGSGPLPSLPWGRPDLTVGLERRIVRTPARTLQREYPITVANNYQTHFYAQGSTTDSGYIEMKVPLSRSAALPLVHALELQLSGRGERYTVDTGTSSELIYYNQTPPRIQYSGTTLNGQPYFSKASYTSSNYTMGLKYQPVEALTVRVSRASAFLPPTPAQLLEDPLTYFEQYNRLVTQVVDPKSGVTTPIYVDTLSGGNPDLKPQNARSFNAGVIWKPRWQFLQGLRLNAEYYRIEQFDAIDILTAQQIVNQESTYPSRVVRNGSGTITLVNTSLVNLYHRDTAGWDLSVDHSVNTGIGRFNLHAAGSVILRLRSQYKQTLPEYEAVGYSPAEGGAGKYKTNATLSWDWRQWTAGWNARYFSSYKVVGAAGGPLSAQQANGGIFQAANFITPQGSDTVPAQLYHDLFISYAVGSDPHLHVLQGLTMQLGVRNVFAKVPPLDVSYDSNFYISPYGDIRLRSFWLQVRRAFGN